MRQTNTATFEIVVEGAEPPYVLTAMGPGLDQPIRASLADHDAWLTTELRNILDVMPRERFADGELPPEAIQRLGRRLFEVLFGPDIAVAFGAARAMQKDKGLRLRLEIVPPELSALPWETMRDANGWLSTRGDTPLVRCFPAPAGVFYPSSLRISPPLRILFVGASPANKTPIEIEAIADRLGEEEVLGKLIARKVVAFETLLHPTTDALLDKLAEDFHAIVFVCHGGFDETNGLRRPVIFLEDEDGAMSPLPAKDHLADWLREKPTRLVLVAACNTAANTDETGVLLRSFAQELCETVPAVIAMQYSVSDLVAPAFVEQYLQLLAAFRPVDVAMAEARQSLILPPYQAGRDVFAPVMYLQTDDGALFRKARNWAKIALIAILPVVVTLALLVYFSVKLDNVRSRLEEAQKSYETAPLLGTAKALEAWYDVPLPYRRTWRKRIEDDYLRPWASQGKLLKLGNDDVAEIILNDTDPYVLVRRTGDQAEWVNRHNQEIVTLPGEVSQAWFSNTGAFLYVRYLKVAELAPVFIPSTGHISYLDRSVNNDLVTVLHTNSAEPVMQSTSIDHVGWSPHDTYVIYRYIDRQDNLYFVRIYDTRTGKSSGLLDSIGDRVWDVEFSSDEKNYIVVFQDDTQFAELHSTERGFMISLSGHMPVLTYSPNGAFMAVDYVDNIPPGGIHPESELVNLTTGKKTPIASSGLHTFEFSTNGMHVEVREGPRDDMRTSKLLRLDTMREIPLLGETFDVKFSPDGQSYYIDYVFITDSLHYSGSDERIPLDGTLFDVRYSPSGKYAVIDFEDRDSLLWNTHDRTFASLPGDVRFTTVCFALDETYVFAEIGEYPNAASIAQPLSGNVGEPTPLVIQTDCTDTANMNEYHAFDQRLAAETYWVSPNGAYAVVDYSDQTVADEVWHLRSRPKQVPLGDDLWRMVGFSANGTYFIMENQKSVASLWRGTEPTRLLATLGYELKQYSFNENASRLTYRLQSGQAFVLDLEWLDQISDPQGQTSILASACRPFSDDAVSLRTKDLLRRSIGRERPRVCN